jgi:iron complex outermembrane receptor protein
VSHTFKNFLTTTLEYSIINDLIQETNEQRGTIYYSRPGNFGRQSVYGITVNGNITIKPWWTLQLYSEAKNIDINTTIYGQPLVENRWYWYVGPVNQWKINDKLNAELGGSYQTRILSGQFLTISVWQMRMGASYKILKNNGTLRFSLTDMFYTNQPGGDIRNIANSKANWLSYLDTRVATISFSYRFNKGKSLQARQNSGVDTEKSRVKT